MENQSKYIVSNPKEMRVLADITLASEEKLNKQKRKHSEMSENHEKSEVNSNRPDDICQKKQKCEFCQQTFFEIENLQKHVKRLHPDDSKINNMIIEKSPQESGMNIDSKKENFKEVENPKIKNDNDVNSIKYCDLNIDPVGKSLNINSSQPSTCSENEENILDIDNKNKPSDDLLEVENHKVKNDYVLNSKMKIYKCNI